eukprot:m.140076 g.140076  ORF g.140076 m.140076 type:complete len:232 (-) comp17650_c0_seq6:1792-2487(-)
MSDSSDQRPEVVYAGFMVKQGKIFKSWRNRWFELTNDRRLRYYRQYPGPGQETVPGSEAGTIDLMRCTRVLSSTEISSIKWPTSDTTTCFGLVLPNRTYYLICAHPDECKDWQTYCKLHSIAGDNSEAGDFDTDRSLETGSAARLSSKREDDIGSGVVRSNSYVADSESDDEDDSMSGLVSALMANPDVNFKRSMSTARVRADTATQQELRQEAEIIREKERKVLLAQQKQ